MPQVIFNSNQEFLDFIISNYINYNFQMRDYEFIDNSNGEIKLHINDIFLHTTKEKFNEYLSEICSYVGESEQDVINEHSCNIIQLSQYFDSPPLINFILDHEPDFTLPCDNQGGHAIESTICDNPNNVEILFHRGLDKFLNIEIKPNSLLCKEDIVYPIHLLCKYSQCLEIKLDIIKLYKKYGADFNVKTRYSQETCLMMYLKDLFDKQQKNPFLQGVIHDLEVDIIYELITKENFDIQNNDGLKPKDLILELNISDEKKYKLLNKFNY